MPLLEHDALLDRPFNSDIDRRLFLGGASALALTMQRIILLITAAIVLSSWTHGGGAPNFLTDNPGTTILTGVNSSDLLLPQ